MSENQAVLKQQKNKAFYDLYIKNVPVVYASVQAPKEKYNSKEKHFELTAFLNEETKAFLEDEVGINKSMMKVGVDKNKKRNIKYPLSSQQKVEEGKEPNPVYDPYEGMYGISLTLDEINKKTGKVNTLDVVDQNGDDVEDLVGNGSICSVKLFGYRNQDELLNAQLKLVKVVELVPYEGGDGSYEDEELGITIKAKKKAEPQQESPAATVKETPKVDDFDDDIPF